MYGMGCTSNGDIQYAINRKGFLGHTMDMPSKQERDIKGGHNFRTVLNGSAAHCKVSAKDKKCFALRTQSSHQLI
jgi:hypothetical protein